MIDDKGNYVVDRTWFRFSEPEDWSEISELPDNSKIIGFKCETEGYEINKLKF